MRRAYVMPVSRPGSGKLSVARLMELPVTYPVLLLGRRHRFSLKRWAKRLSLSREQRAASSGRSFPPFHRALLL